MTPTRKTGSASVPLTAGLGQVPRGHRSGRDRIPLLPRAGRSARERAETGRALGSGALTGFSRTARSRGGDTGPIMFLGVLPIGFIARGSEVPAASFFGRKALWPLDTRRRLELSISRTGMDRPRPATGENQVPLRLFRSARACRSSAPVPSLLEIVHQDSVEGYMEASWAPVPAPTDRRRARGARGIGSSGAEGHREEGHATSHPPSGLT